MLTVVAGALGAGKTRWIWDQMTALKGPEPLIYINPLTIGVDAYRLLLDMPHLQIEADLSKAVQVAKSKAIYLELPHHLSLELPSLDEVPHRKVAVINAHASTRVGWELWADEVVISSVLSSVDISASANTDVWQASLQGQVLDPASLHTFWQELVQGAYGQMMRTKAVFELADGQAIYVDHLPRQETTYQDLPLPKWLEGRPQRFSGIEMVGQGLDKVAIASTLQDCCLTDATLASHQAALKQSQTYSHSEAA
ncbi:MAG: GTP-binding protein [Phormidesmis sp. RL_2_1]|nr:GTP-binding protein [Phormidesmis sp. RL_2_1]